MGHCKINYLCAKRASFVLDKPEHNAVLVEIVTPVAGQPTDVRVTVFKVIHTDNAIRMLIVDFRVVNFNRQACEVLNVLILLL